MLKRIGAVLLALELAGCTISDTTGPGYSDFQSVIDDYAAGYNIPGVLALVAQPESIWVGASGQSDRFTGRFMRPTDKFRAASLTKTFTATIVLQMTEEGLLDLDDSIEFYLEQDIVDSISIIDSQSYGFLITIRMLLSHRSGVNDFADESFYNRLYTNPGRYWHPEDLINYAIRMGDALFIPDLLPADEHSYSNTNYILLGMIIEERTGRQFQQVLRERIYNPVGMPNTYLAERENIPPEIASGYDGDNDVSSFNYSFEWANAGIVTTTEDTYRFLKALMNGQLFSSSSTLAEMENPNGYGLGLQATVTTSGVFGYGHFGESLGFVSFMMYLPSVNSYIIASMNQRLANEDALYLDLLSLIE